MKKQKKNNYNKRTIERGSFAGKASEQANHNTLIEDASYLIAHTHHSSNEFKTSRTRARRATQERSPAYYSDLQVAWEYAGQRCSNPFSRARKRVALLILYLTGMRLSSLLLMTVHDLKSLMNFADTGQGTLRVPGVNNRHELKDTIILPPTAQPLVASRRDDLSLLIASQADDQNAFRRFYRGKYVTQRRDLFTKELNRILGVVGIKSNKRLTTHSFRIGIITSVIKRYGIDAAQHLAGHRNVVATSAYSKRRLRDQDITRMLNNVLNPEIKR